MAPLPSNSGLEWPQSLARAVNLGTPTIKRMASIVARQNPATVTVTETVVVNNDDGGNNAQTLSGGAIAGIIIGSVIGVLLLLWIIRSCFNIGAPPQDREKWYRDVPPQRHRHRHRSRSRRSSVTIPPAAFVATSRSRSRSRRPSATYVYDDRRRGRSGSRGQYAY